MKHHVLDLVAVATVAAALGVGATLALAPQPESYSTDQIHTCAGAAHLAADIIDTATSGGTDGQDDARVMLDQFDNKYAACGAVIGGY